jgi:hypothetical protein
MFDVKINKVFKDPNTMLDMYVLSIQFGDKYYNLTLSKEEIDKLCIRLKSMHDNNEIE